MGDLYAIRLDNIKDTSFIFHTLCNYVSTEKRKRIEKYRNMDDALRSLIGESVVRYVLMKACQLKKLELKLKTNEYGKPYIDTNPNIQFNISHSGKWVVCAFSSEPVGVDIEKIKLIDLDVAKYICTNEEQEILMSKGDIERLNYFYDIWTLKESYVKSIGMGLSVPLKDFTICLRDNEISIKKLDGRKLELYLKQYNIDPNYKLSICSKSNDIPLHIKMLTVDELITGLIKSY